MIMTDMKDICNILAEQFVLNSSSDNYSHRLNYYRLTIERKIIDFDTYNHYSYHMIHHQVLIQFSIYLWTVCYYFCIFLIDIFNNIWLTQDFPISWKTAIIIPVPKPGNVLSYPGSYRVIALTSCLCKTMERMVNSRLTWYLERHMVINKFQS